MKLKLTAIDGTIFSAITTLIGIGFNQIVIQANHGMPVANIFPEDKWVPLTVLTKYKFLSDILPFQTSIGDWFIWIGLAGCAVFLVLFLKSGYKKSEARYGRSINTTEN